MFGLSGGHLLILAVVVLLFGRNRLPELGSAMGRGLNAFKNGLAGNRIEEKADKKLAEKKLDDQSEVNATPSSDRTS